jgi:hypothetical protein
VHWATTRRTQATVGAHAFLETFANGLATLLKLSIRHLLDAAIDPERSLHAVGVEGVLLRIHTDLGGEASTVGRGEVRRDVSDLREKIEIGGEAGNGAVEEDQVLHEEHEFFGHAGAVAQECLHDPLQLLGELIGCHRGRVDDLVEKAKVLGDSFEVGVVG